MIKTGEYSLSTLLQDSERAVALRDKIVDMIPVWVGIDSWMTQEERSRHQVMNIKYSYDPEDEMQYLEEEGALRRGIDEIARSFVGLANGLPCDDLPIVPDSEIPRLVP
jgi:hypothetical protein